MGLLSWWFGEDKAREDIAATEDRLRIENAKDEARLGEAWRAEVEANQRREREALILTSGEEFREGFSDAVTERRKGFGELVSLPFRLIPWQLWILAGLVLFWYLGGVSAVQRRVAKSS